ncbi:MAG: hypothetical protein QM731_06605 [Chitinophagaceae bacterium]
MFTIITTAGNLIKRFLFYDSRILEWLIRVLLTLNIISAGVPRNNHGYPFDVLVLSAIGFWLYIGRLKLLALTILTMALFITYQHLGLPPYEYMLDIN